jgi:tRNA pseudouridine38-40 synthase
MRKLSRELSPNFARYAVGVQYFGPSFSGWTVTKNDVTHETSRPNIPAKIQQAVELFVGPGNYENFKVSSRTDAGVHAFRNVFQVDLVRRHKHTGPVMLPHDESNVQKALNNFLRDPHLLITDVETKDADYDCRGFTTGRTYTFRILNRIGDADWTSKTRRSDKDMYHQDLAWVLTDNCFLDIEQMRVAASLLIGDHDFKSFQAQGCDSISTVRSVSRLDIKEYSFFNEDKEMLQSVLLMSPRSQIITITITANAFLRKMIRNIVAALVHVGKKKMSIPHFKYLFESKQAYSIPPAPPQGLYLVDVHYDKGKITSFQRALQKSARNGTAGCDSHIAGSTFKMEEAEE